MGGSTTSRTTQAPAQLLPEANEGFQLSQDFYKGVLNNPPLFAGKRIASRNPYQNQFISQSGASFGAPTNAQQAGDIQATSTLSNDYFNSPIFGRMNPNEVAPTSSAYNNIVGDTASGRYLNAIPGAQNFSDVEANATRAIEAMSRPLFAKLQNETLPGIGNRAQFTGQGVTGTRRGVAENAALGAFGTELGSSVVAPIFSRGLDFVTSERDRLAAATQAERNLQLGAAGLESGRREQDLGFTTGERALQGGLFSGERNRQIQALEQVPRLQAGETLRLAGLRGAGDYESQLQQQQIDSEREKFEEPLFRRSQAADSLQAAGVGTIGPGSSTTKGSEKQSALGTIGQIASIAGAAAAVAMV